MSLKNWSTTAANNATVDSISFAEGQAPSSLNDSARALMADMRNELGTRGTIASATTCDLGTKDEGALDITGTTTITGLGTVSAGIKKHVRFIGALTLTHNATSLILPGGANITTAANDTALFESLGSGNWICLYYQKADGAQLFIASAAQGDILYRNASAWVRLAAGTSGQFLKTQGTGANPIWDTVSSGVTLGTPVATTSGTSRDITGFSSTAKLIAMPFSGVSTSGSSDMVLRLGTSGTPQTTGYLGTMANIGSSNANYTTYFTLRVVGASSVTHGIVILVLLNSSTNTWAIFSGLGGSDAAQAYVSMGTVSLSGALDIIRLTTAGGSDTFDAGSINVLTLG